MDDSWVNCPVCGFKFDVMDVGTFLTDDEVGCDITCRRCGWHDESRSPLHQITEDAVN